VSEAVTPPVVHPGGADRLWVFEGGGEGCKKTIFDPWASDCAENVFLPYRFYAVQHEADLVLIDCGAHPSLAADPAQRLGGQVEFSNVAVAPGDDVVSKLTAAGLDPAAVSHVILTHLHYDHCGGLELLPRSEVHVQRDELSFAEDPPVYQALSYIRADWAGVTRWNLHDGRHDLFGDGSVVLVPTPGHSRGHQSVELAFPGEPTLILVGDAAFRPLEMESRTLPGYLWSPDAVLASWEYLEARRRHDGAELLLTHFPYREG
jgi:N-acyl homoserine lactone hydrolase